MLITEPTFVRQMDSNPVLFETFWNEIEQREICTGFSLIVNWSNPHPGDVAVFNRLKQLSELYKLGIHLERTSQTRKIHFGVADTPCYDPHEHKTVISLVELELGYENSPAFDWLINDFEHEEPEEATYTLWPTFRIDAGPGLYWIAADIPGRFMHPPLSIFCRAKVTARFFVPYAAPTAIV